MQCLTFLRLFDSLTTFIYYNIYGECFRWLQQFSLHHINTSLGFQTEGGWGGGGAAVAMGVTGTGEGSPSCSQASEPDCGTVASDTVCIVSQVPLRVIFFFCSR